MNSAGHINRTPLEKITPFPNTFASDGLRDMLQKFVSVGTNLEDVSSLPEGTCFGTPRYKPEQSLH